MNAIPLRLEDLRITLNGTFVRSSNDIDDRDIEKLIEAARANEDSDHDLLLEVRRRAIGAAKVSAIVFYSKREAYFAPQHELFDTIASYLVVVETGLREFTLFKKSCATLTPLLEKDYEVAEYEELLNTFDDSRSQIQKLSTREMNVSDKGLRARSYEAADLKGHMSPHAAGRSIPRFTQVRTKNEVRSISLNTGRINQLTERVSVGKAIEWSAKVFTSMSRRRVNKSFFSSFARRISLEEVLKVARPASILFERFAIEEHLTEDSIDLWYTKNGKYHKLKTASLKRFLDTLDVAFEIDDHQNMIGTRSGKLRINKKTLSPYSAALSRLKVKGPKDYITFQSWITDHGYFVVSFDRPDYLYIKKSCFENRAGKAEVDAILTCLEPMKSFSTAMSEKGDVVADSTAFDPSSLFARVEHIHRNDKYVFCDDLGTEWADHIAIDLDAARITFVHSKHAKKSSNSASALHEVIGQAIKNLGSMHFTSTTFSAKVNQKFNRKYKGSQIERTRKGNYRNANNDIKVLLADPRLHRKCVVACSSLSKRDVTVELEKLKRGLVVKGHITQLFWIISSFIHSCQGNACYPAVYCKP
ncbi:hypothetical protein [Pseudoxanthomonas sp.]|uniref:hypothetical protein n=1 Tax=Pseudoxanthomonas sp. TaxID=1871049 RepID=UPI003F818574